MILVHMDSKSHCDMKSSIMETHWLPLPGPTLSYLKLAPWEFLIRGADKFHVVGSAGGVRASLPHSWKYPDTLQSTILGTVLEPSTQGLCWAACGGFHLALNQHPGHSRGRSRGFRLPRPIMGAHLPSLLGGHLSNKSVLLGSIWGEA